MSSAPVTSSAGNLGSVGDEPVEHTRYTTGAHLVNAGLIEVEPWSLSNEYKRKHNTLVEAARILAISVVMIFVSIVTIPWRLIRGRKL